MIRKGRFAIYGNEEYELISYQHQYYLRTEDCACVSNGFEKLNGSDNEFIKSISVKDLEDAYEIFPYVMMKGYRFAVEGFNEEKATFALVTNNPFVQKKINVRPYGKLEYIIEVPANEVEIIEDRLQLFGFDSSLT